MDVTLTGCFVEKFRVNEQLVMLQLLLGADEYGRVAFSDRKVSKVTNIPYQQVRTIHRRLLERGVIVEGGNAGDGFVTICKSDCYKGFKKMADAAALEERANDETPAGNAAGTAAGRGKSGFVPPTVEEVTAYLTEKGYGDIDAREFVDFYGASGWMRGKTKITNWKLCVNTWHKKGRENVAVKASEPDTRPLYERFNTWVANTFPNLRDCEPLGSQEEYDEVLKMIGGNKAIAYTMGQLNNDGKEGRIYDVIKEYCGRTGQGPS